MSDHITACRKCPSTTFLVHERQTWFGRLDGETPDMSCTNPDCEIEDVTCTECGTVYQPNQITSFNFN
jgi:hypothetical protein